MERDAGIVKDVRGALAAVRANLMVLRAPTKTVLRLLPQAPRENCSFPAESAAMSSCCTGPTDLRIARTHTPRPEIGVVFRSAATFAVSPLIATTITEQKSPSDSPRGPSVPAVSGHVRSGLHYRRTLRPDRRRRQKPRLPLRCRSPPRSTRNCRIPRRPQLRDPPAASRCRRSRVKNVRLTLKREGERLVRRRDYHNAPAYRHRHAGVARGAVVRRQVRQHLSPGRSTLCEHISSTRRCSTADIVLRSPDDGRDAAHPYGGAELIEVRGVEGRQLLLLEIQFSPLCTNTAGTLIILLAGRASHDCASADCDGMAKVVAAHFI